MTAPKPVRLTQRLVAAGGSVYDTRPVLAGPWEFVVEDHTFKVVLVKCNDNKSGTLSAIDTRTGRRIFKVECRAVKSFPHAAMRAVDEAMMRLVAQKCGAYVAWTLREAPSLPEL